MFKVKVKDWEEMEEEYGLDSQGDINCKHLFIKAMEEILPLNRIIYLDKDFVNSSYGYSKDMIKDFFVMKNIWINIKAKYSIKKRR